MTASWAIGLELVIIFALAVMAWGYRLLANTFERSAHRWHADYHRVWRELDALKSTRSRATAKGNRTRAPKRKAKVAQRAAELRRVPDSALSIVEEAYERLAKPDIMS